MADSDPVTKRDLIDLKEALTESLTELVRDKQPQVRGTALRALIAVRRLEISAIEKITAQAAEQRPEVIEKTVERALEDILRPSLPGVPELRLDGSRFSTPLRR